ncbi:MAG: hypothetical protein LKCHEGNO_00921 [Burkholderiaceae bacterium]|nr:hypothetical protein [Burkholderiaceae bacterium]
MDEIVKAALKKWPTVPHCYDWLALDARGQWFMRDERIRRAGAFPQVKGSLIRHELLLQFIHRNYECDARGCWYFQNGPQRVYVELEAAPLVWRVQWIDPDTPRVQAHTGEVAAVRAAWVDQHGRLFLQAERGLGIVHSQDMLDAARAIEQGLWSPQPLPFEAMPERFGYVLRPERTAGSAR